MSIATPCPAPNGLSGLPIPIPNRRLSTASNSTTQDDTVELEYTRAIEVNLKHAPPRRRSTFYKRPKKGAAVTIFEDVLEDEELVVPERAQIGGSTLLGKPAQRNHGHAMRKSEAMETQSQNAPAMQEKRRMSAIISKSSVSECPRIDQAHPEQKLLPQHAKDQVRGGLVKEPRRRTIFIPGEDTTIMTIHPGADKTARLDDTFQRLEHGMQQSHDQEHHPEVFKQRKKPRMSLAAAPRRVPLQPVAVKDSNGSGIDLPGRNGGKENNPPNSEVYVKEKTASQPVNSQPPPQAVTMSTLFAPTAASRARQSLVPRNAVPFTTSQGGSQAQRGVQQLNSPRAGKAQQEPQARLSLRPSPPRQETQISIASITGDTNLIGCTRTPPTQRAKLSERRLEAKTARLSQYQVLPENLAQPELYEDSWLSHQEVALTELVNQIFRSAETKPKQWRGESGSLRERMVRLYHRSQVTTLHRRLKASLLCGALSLPKDSSRPPNPAHDIGLRRRFLSLWLESYHTECLSVAAEVVFGRELPKSCDTGASVSTSTLDPHRSRRATIRFLETFLVEVDDVEEPDEERGDDPNARWRKMILRSLMLIWLLDQAKTLGLVRGCLFKTASPRKSSVAVLHALASMLIPSAGEITRILRHLDYEIVHIQDPLDEVKYQIGNIAVDLRDGILLTKLVEILLFSPTRIKHMNPGGDATVTIQMPDFTILESALYHAEDTRAPYILSQHLKMPCLGRAQKVYNVQIALSTLNDHGRLTSTINDVTADDIVDGHREKTLSLLWSLASSHGLEELVDFRELAADIKRTADTPLDALIGTVKNEHLSQSTQESLFKKWASAYASRQGIRIGNLTTSFADGRAYSAILDAYTEYLDIGNKVPSASSTNSGRLDSQLRALGCSHAFGKQFRTSNGTIPSRKTTISNLAFLASRLLPLARQHNAARTIQRAFRLRRSRAAISQRVVLARLAHACATVVQTQQKLIAAATVLQRAWRVVLDVRIRRLNSNAELFQTAARAWLIRRRCQRFVSVQAPRMIVGW